MEKVLRTPRSAVLMESALRLIQGDAHQWSEQTRSCPAIRGSGYPTKLTEPRFGLFATGAPSEAPTGRVDGPDGAPGRAGRAPLPRRARMAAAGSGQGP